MPCRDLEHFLNGTFGQRCSFCAINSEGEDKGTLQIASYHFLILFWVVPGMEPGDSSILGKCSVAEPYPQTCSLFLSTTCKAVQ